MANEEKQPKPAKHDAPEDDAPAEVEAPAHTDIGAQNDDDTTPFDDEKTGRAIDDIVATESDELLRAQDEATARLQPAKVKRRGQGLRHFLGRWFGSAWGRWLTFLVLAGGIGAVAAVPTSRYYLLNKYGVESSASVTVWDDLTGSPLKNVSVAIAGSKALTDASGRAQLHHLRLGPQELTIQQAGYAALHKRLVVGWGSNPLGIFKLNATGVQYSLQITDYLSGKGIAGAEVSSGQTVALSDKNGKALLPLDPTDAPTVSVTVAKAGYRSEQLDIANASTAVTPVALVSDRKAVFVSKQNGRYDVYKSDIDGKNRTLLLAGTGTETANISLAVSDDGQRAALVSTRDNQRDADGYLLTTLTLINIDDGTVVTLAHAEQVQLLGWIGPRIIFEQVTNDPHTPYTVASYDYMADSRAQLAAAKHLNTAFVAQGSVYYAVAVDHSDAAVTPGLFKINPDGSNKQTAVSKEVWSAARASYNVVEVQTPDAWLSYDLAAGSTATISGPSSLGKRQYLDNAARGQSLWIDSGLGMLQRYDIAANKDAAVANAAGITYPVRWLTDDSVVYRSVTAAETADYAVSIASGVPHRIASDIVNTYGFAPMQ